MSPPSSPTAASDLWATIREKLEEQGIDLDHLLASADEPTVKVVCIAPDLQETLQEMGRSSRDRVVMVRVDEETSSTLDAWVDTGAVRSRSEAAALFIREGLKVRSAELDQLRDVLEEVQVAKDRLQERVREVFGREDGST